MLGPERDALNCDGWEHADAYHWMVKQAGNARFVMVMPDLLLENGAVSVYSIPYRENFWALVDYRILVRMYGFIGFAIGAHEVVKRRLPTL